MTEWLTYREFVEEMKADVARDAVTLKGPEADWQPRLYHQGPDPFASQPIPGGVFKTQASKEVLFTSIAAVVRILGVRIVGIRVTQYVSFVDYDSMTPAEHLRAIEHHELPDHIPRPSQDPNRHEMLSLHVVDAERYEAWYAPLRRRRYGRPLLDEWELMGGRPDAMFGPLIDPIRAALR